jgi:hypothetical protein
MIRDLKYGNPTNKREDKRKRLNKGTKEGEQNNKKKIEKLIFFTFVWN